MVRIGTAGWSIPSDLRDEFGSGGSVLERYATRFDAVEVNSSFYRPHRPSTYARWAASVPDGFRFAVKLPRTITHECRLVGAEDRLGVFLGECRALGDRLGPLLVQLPPSLGFDPGTAAAFFDRMRRDTPGAIVCEPRHPGWFKAEADALLARFAIARVAANPPPVPGADRPAGWPGLAYWRLHGSPRIYYSDYPQHWLGAMAATIGERAGVERWVIFDNTAVGCATRNALALAQTVGLRDRG